jgi:sulfatase-modifying factor enzyme 1
MALSLLLPSLVGHTEGAAIMKRVVLSVSLVVGLLQLAGPRERGVGARRCGPREVEAGTVCLDAFEASVWRIPEPETTNAPLVRQIQVGTATREALVANGATQLGTSSDDYEPCADNGQNCAKDIFAVSLPAETPSAFISWFQAQEACANAGKRLPTSAEWQVGANGTPDPQGDDGTTDCNVATETGVSVTGERSACVSSRGARDMVGNLAEWVSDWVAAPTVCPGWASFSDDQMCLSGASTTQNSPGALVRGGAFAAVGGRRAGPFSIVTFPPFHSTIFLGFRCAR